MSDIQKTDLIGKRFGSLTAIRFLRRTNNVTYWLLKCDCGVETVVSRGNLKRTKSCGCLQYSKPAAMKHGMANSTEYTIWANMKNRCTNTKTKEYKDYGGRGIKVCDRWLESFENFFQDMGKRPSKKYTLDRIDNNGDYTPENCRWATIKTQARNKRSCVWIEFQGVKKLLSEWALDLGMSHQTLSFRLNSGWSVKRALTEPVGEYFGESN